VLGYVTHIGPQRKGPPEGLAGPWELANPLNSGLAWLMASGGTGQPQETGGTSDPSGHDPVQEALRRSEERYRAFIAYASEGIWRFELDEPIPTELPVAEQVDRAFQSAYLAECNDAMARMYGFEKAEEIVNRRLTEFLDREKNYDYICAFIRTGYRLTDAESVETDRHGKTVAFLNNLVGTVEGGRLVRVWGTQRDITDRKVMEQKLEQLVVERTAKLQEMIGELESFSYSITHDLRAPLRALQGFAQILREQAHDRLREDELGYLERMITAALRMDALIRDVLEYGRIMKAELALRPVNVEALINDIVRSYPQFQPPGGDIEIAQPLLPVLGNEAAMTQIISNLLSNAVKFVAPGVSPKVRIRTESRGDRVRLSFEDNGVGIPENLQTRIFELFQRAHGAEYEGTGLGLAIVRKAAERMHGTVAVESEPGKGSRFWVELQAAK
jgi:PAS domain S-box-containing protein